MTVDAEIDEIVRIETDTVTLEGNLIVPTDAHGIVLFAHGSGSSRHSPRNRFVAHKLHEAGLATLLIDLLPEEVETDQPTHELRFDIQLLADRLTDSIEWLTNHSRTSSLTIGLFGGSTGAGAALIAASSLHLPVQAVVSRGGRTDLAGDALPRVKVPTLLIVGGNDPQVVEINRKTIQKMTGQVELEIIPDASHLFQESGTLERVAELASDWFLRHLPHKTPSSTPQ